MTRESALYASGAYEGIHGETPELLVNMIFDYFEAQLKAKDEEIERLKELIRRYESDE